jgi:hypothetical protein
MKQPKIWDEDRKESEDMARRTRQGRLPNASIYGKHFGRQHLFTMGKRKNRNNLVINKKKAQFNQTYD